MNPNHLHTSFASVGVSFVLAGVTAARERGRMILFEVARGEEEEVEAVVEAGKELAAVVAVRAAGERNKKGLAVAAAAAVVAAAAEGVVVVKIVGLIFLPGQKITLFV